MQTRARACQALLHILSRKDPQDAIGKILAQEGVAVREQRSNKPGASLGLRLLPGKALEAALPQLRQEVAKALVEEPPYAMRWMRGHPCEVGMVLPPLAASVKSSHCPCVSMLNSWILLHGHQCQGKVAWSVHGSPQVHQVHI
jgi:hypothetical protein